MIKKQKNGNNNKRKKMGGIRMKTETRKRENSISTKLLQKHYKNNKRNNINSIGCNNCSITNISRNNNKLSI